MDPYHDCTCETERSDSSKLRKYMGELQGVERFARTIEENIAQRQGGLQILSVIIGHKANRFTVRL